MASAINHGTPIPSVGPTWIAAGRAVTTLTSPVHIKEAKLCYTTDTGPWQKRAWTTVAARVDGKTLVAELPAGRPLVGFLSLTDERGLRVSGEHFEMGK